MKDIVCKKCNWSWDKDKNDSNIYLCHKCGYDNKTNNYNFHEFNKWKREFNKPYSEEVKTDYNIRKFSSNVDNSELVWHRDKEDRLVEVIGKTDWLFQMDNELPIKLEGKFFIPKNTYHRIIKGNGDLFIKVKKLDT